MTVTPRRIHILDTTLANQIAAGEVIERPASVLKELLENALDAGASQIQVVIEAGGSGLVQVRDNGAGIHAEDLAFALQRHATSKINSLQDLEAIQSLGFRGEALPSIASVARLSLESRPAGEDSGWQLRCEGGAFTDSPAPVAHPPGTTVSVRDLFYNTPARRKFLRTRRTELQQIETLFKRLALVCFEVRLELIHEGRSLLRLPRAGTSAARRQRVGRLLGKAFSEQAIAIDQEAGDLRLRGWLGPSEISRERNDMQFLYINNRAVSDPVCRHAVRLAYDDLLAPGQHPAWVLYLDIDPRQVDVNVHPAKQEVRFHETRMVHDFIRSSVRAMLAPELPLAAPAEAVKYPLSATPQGAGARQLAQAPGSFRTQPSVQPPAATGVDDTLQGLHLFEERWWLGLRYEKFYLADIQVVAEHLCREALEHLLNAPPAQSRPLLLPAGLTLNDKQVAVLEGAAQALARLGLELRISGPDRAMLLTVPLVLARVPGEALAEAIAGGLETMAHPGEAQGWIPLLARCAGRHPRADLKQAGQMLEHLLQVHEKSPAGAWRELQASDLTRWLRERA